MAISAVTTTTRSGYRTPSDFDVRPKFSTFVEAPAAYGENSIALNNPLSLVDTFRPLCASSRTDRGEQPDESQKKER